MKARIRPADLSADRDAILAIDTSFETEAVFSLARTARGLALVETRLDAPVRKTFPLDDLDDEGRPWTLAYLAERGGRAVAFAAAEFRPWNRRMVLWHLYVDPSARRLGLARRLIATVEDDARAAGALCLWLETSNLNRPGVRAYERMGFALSGIDAGLYQGTAAEGEFALFLERPL